jgi:hypothetical protein
MLREELLRDRACGALDRPQPAREHRPICDNDQLREFGALLAGFIEGQNLPPALFMEIQSILDALLISLAADSGAHQPFIMEGDRIEGARRRLGVDHVARLKQRPLTVKQRDQLLPLAARTCGAFDTLKMSLRGN